ncbi:MAG: hypothetical protein QHJ34_13685 [bacterium]|nr:hypothetical protein [candidate division KSB1 bacterium]MDH7561263.1 hypothetical protein [bacterium]
MRRKADQSGPAIPPPRPWLVSASLALLAGALVILACHKQPELPAEVPLARVGERVITVDEFLRRAEYTPRPPYCRGDSYVHRKIVLNTLIAEKLLAMEAGAENELANNAQFRAYLRGRQEQAMRQWLFYRDFYAQIRLKRKDVAPRFQASTRTYRVAYYTFSGDSLAQLLREHFSAGRSFAAGFPLVGGVGLIPEREVAWSRAEHEAIKRALFSKPFVQGDVVGPVRIDDTLYTVMQVQGWKQALLLSDTQMRQQWSDVEEAVRQERAEQAYLQFVQKAMRGKKMVLVEDTFYRLAATLAPLFLASPQEKRQAFNRGFWQQGDEELVVDRLGDDIAQLRTMPLLRIDGTTWTVADLEKELDAHPLVFRTRHIKKGEFPAQLRLAIADLIRDKYIAQEAYKRGYDRALPVQRNVQMWQDHILALYQRNLFLRARGQEGDLSRVDVAVIEQHLNPYVRELQKKYSDQIEIDTDRFERLKLTRLDMLVLQRGAPYPVLVPMFPLLTTVHPLDYGHKMGG